jgi:imidazolonepropionase
MTLLIHASQLLTLAGGKRRGQALSDLRIVPDGAVLYRDGILLETGATGDLLSRHPQEPTLDARGRVVMPGFIDPHTHLIWAGDRSNEFEMRLQGKTYMEILAQGGGILSTVRATRQADEASLLAPTRARAAAMFRHGTTTVEAKTGYGLDSESELKQLAALYALNGEGLPEIIPTYLGAHAIAPEYAGDPDGYTKHLVETMLPDLATWWKGHVIHFANHPVPFVDVFCEKGAFNLAQSRRILVAASRLGFPLKIHVDEFENLGGARMAVEMNAASADHLVKTSLEEIALFGHSETVAVSLPCTPFGLGHTEYTPAREIIAAGGLLALATDCNPGTAWNESMQFVIALACRAMKLTPAEAISAATINAAAAIRQEHRIGSIEPGKQADLLILDAEDYRHLGYRFGTNLVDTVIKRGKEYPAV